MPVLMLAVVVAAAPIRLASTGFTQTGLTQEQAAFYADHFALQLGAHPALKVVTQEDMARVLGIERQRQLLGCADDSTGSCMAELAGALGAEGIVTGKVARIGARYQLNVKIIANGGARALFQHSSDLLASEEALLRELATAADDASIALEAALRGVAHHSPLKLLPGALGLVAAGIGVGFWVDAGAKFAALSMESWPSIGGQANAAALRDVGSRNQWIGVALVASGAALMAASLAWFALAPDVPVATVAPVPGGGAGVSFGGALP